MKNMKDEIILEALKEAIIDAFFNQKTFYNPQTGYNVSYRGQIVEVVQKILQMDSIKTLIEEIVKEIASNKDKIKEKLNEKLEIKILTEAEKVIAEDKQYISDWVKWWIKEKGKEIVNQTLENSEKVRAFIEEAVGKEDVGGLKIEKNVEIKITNKN
jgi:hypothetical protein